MKRILKRVAAGLTGVRSFVMAGAVAGTGGGRRPGPQAATPARKNPLITNAGRPIMRLKPCCRLLAVLAALAFAATARAQTSVTLTTSSTSPWTVPAGVTSLQVQMWGGGGGGGASIIGTGAGGGTGGGGGGYTAATLSVTPGSQIAFVVGAGGAGAFAKSSTVHGGNGGDTTFTGAITAGGGEGGYSPVNGIGGLGGTYNGGAGGLRLTKGKWGTGGGASGCAEGIGGAGGDQVGGLPAGPDGGAGGTGTNSNVGPNEPGGFPGGGGSGCYQTNFSGFSGGAGAPGQIIITYTGSTVTITSGLTVNSKTYDGTTTATIASNNVVLSGVQAGDAGNVFLSTNGYTATFASAGAANGVTVTVSGLTLTGSAASKYALNQPTGLTANITAKALTAQGTLSLTSKVYDGTTGAAPTGAAALQSTEAAGSGTTTDGKPYAVDSVSLTGTAAYAYNSSTVTGANTVTASGLSLTGAGSGNYTLSAPSLSATITAKPLTALGTLAVSSKVYDGTANATPTGAAALQSPEAAGSGTPADGKPYAVDSVSLTGTAAYAYNSRNVTTATTVTESGLSLTGTGNGNYTLTQPSLSATITAKPLNYTGITAAGKVYNGNTTASFSGTAATLAAEAAGTGTTGDGKPYTGDTVSFTTGALAGSFASPAVANGIGVTLTSGVTLTAGGQSGDYSVGSSSPALAANITQATVTVASGITANSKIYDSTTTATITSNNVVLSGVLSGDAAHVALATNGYTASFASAPVANGVAVTVGGLTLTGSAAGNYALTQPTGLSANITPGPVTAAQSTVTASPTSVVADGSTTSTITVILLDAYSNPVSGKTVTLVKTSGGGSPTISAASGTSSASGVVTFTVKSTTAATDIFTATDSSDAVTLTQTASVTFTAGAVTAAQSTVTASPTSVVADGSTTSTITVTLLDAYSNPVSGKTVTLAKTSGSGSPTISAASGTSSASGVVTFTVKSTTAATDVFTATDSTDSLTLAQTASVTFTVGAVSAAQSTVTASPTSVVADGSTTSTITVTLLDAYSNPVSGKTVTLAKTSGSGSPTISAASGASSASGVVTFTVKSSTPATGGDVFTATDTSDSVTVAQTATVTFTALQPVATPMTVLLPKGLTALISLGDLATNWSDFYGYPVSLTAINFTSANGLTVFPFNVTTASGAYVVVSNAFLGYYNPTNVADQITYTISDGHGNTTNGVINIVSSASPLFGQITSLINPGGSAVTLKFAGQPGYTYHVQRTQDFIAWKTIWTTNAPPGGPFIYTDTFGDLGGIAPSSAYYRLAWLPNNQ